MKVRTEKGEFVAKLDDGTVSLDISLDVETIGTKALPSLSLHGRDLSTRKRYIWHEDHLKLDDRVQVQISSEQESSAPKIIIYPKDEGKVTRNSIDEYLFLKKELGDQGLI